MHEEIQIIKEKLDLIEKESISQNAKERLTQQEADRYKTILFEFLKSKIGQKIYWAHKAWFNYETHTISGVDIDIQKNNFFGEQYMGKECIRIHLEGGGYYIADNIGKTLFFSEDEAKLHTCRK